MAILHGYSMWLFCLGDGRELGFHVQLGEFMLGVLEGLQEGLDGRFVESVLGDEEVKIFIDDGDGLELRGMLLVGDGDAPVGAMLQNSSGYRHGVILLGGRSLGGGGEDIFSKRLSIRARVPLPRLRLTITREGSERAVWSAWSRFLWRKRASSLRKTRACWRW